MRALLVLLLLVPAVASAAERPDDLVLQASELVSKEKWSDAKALLDRALAQDADHARALYWRALCRLKTGDPEGALADVDRFAQLAETETDRELATSLRVQIENAQPRAPDPEPRAKAGPEVGFVVVGLAVAGAGAVFLGTGLSRAADGNAELDRARHGSGETLYYAGLGMMIGGGVGAFLGIPAGVAHRGRQAKVAVGAAASPEGVELGLAVRW